MTNTSNIGANIRAVRKQRGLTQEDLAKMAGLSTMSVRRYERGDRIITDETVIKIAEALNIEWQKLKGLVFIGFDGDGFPRWGEPESVTELDQIFADILSLRHNVNNQVADRINAALNELNLNGQQEAVKRVEELTEIPRYRRQEAPQQVINPTEGSPTSPPCQQVGTDTAPQEAPQQTINPTEGKDTAPPSNAQETPPEAE